MKDVKGSSSKWINEKKFCPVKFEWQEGFGAFSYGAQQVLKVIEYIKNQKKHHEKISFIEEYKALLKLFNMDFDERFIFKEPE